MTHIYNRRYCSEYMQKINDKEHLEYAVISFDLNNLKVMNDTYGHAKGDILIKSAARVIADTFEKHGVVGRMGGDEFIAILPTIQNEEIEKLLEEFYVNIQKKNQKENDLNLSISYGCARSCELEEKDVEKLYQLADSRMYEHKKAYKKQSKSERG